MNHQNVKFQPGEHYARNNWDKFIEILGVVAGKAIVKGWKISYETVRTDENGNEYIKIDELIYPAYCRLG